MAATDPPPMFRYADRGTLVLRATPEIDVRIRAWPCGHMLPWDDWRKLAGLVVCRWGPTCPECGGEARAIDPHVGQAMDAADRNLRLATLEQAGLDYLRTKSEAAWERLGGALAALDAPPAP